LCSKQILGCNDSVTVHDLLTPEMPAGSLNAYVDQMGYIRWDWADGADTSLETKLLSKWSRGVNGD